MKRLRRWPGMWFSYHTDKIRFALYNISKKTAYQKSFEALMMNLFVALEINRNHKVNMQPLYNVLSAEMAQKALIKIKKNEPDISKTFPELLDVFIKAQFLGR